MHKVHVHFFYENYWLQRMALEFDLTKKLFYVPFFTEFNNYQRDLSIKLKIQKIHRFSMFKI